MCPVERMVRHQRRILKLRNSDEYMEHFDHYTFTEKKSCNVQLTKAGALRFTGLGMRLVAFGPYSRPSDSRRIRLTPKCKAVCALIADAAGSYRCYVPCPFAPKANV